MSEENIPTSIKVTSGEISGTPIIGIEAKPLLTAFREVPGAPCDQPVILYLQEQPFVAVFDDEEKLREQMKLANAGEYKIKMLTDLEEFLVSVTEAGIRVMYNPYPHNGNMRWTELFAPGQEGLTEDQKASQEQRKHSEEYEKWKEQGS